jgi:hypothetical protein
MRIYPILYINKDIYTLLLINLKVGGVDKKIDCLISLFSHSQPKNKIYYYLVS